MAYLARGTTSANITPPGRSEFTVTGTADAGGDTTHLVDAALTQSDTDFWAGATLTMTSGALNGQSFTVTAFNASTDILTFTPAASEAPDTMTYSLRLPPATGPSQVRLYSAYVGGTIAAGTLGLKILVRDSADSTTDYAGQSFPTPQTASVRFGAQMNFGARGIVINTSGNQHPGRVVIIAA